MISKARNRVWLGVVGCLVIGQALGTMIGDPSLFHASAMAVGIGIIWLMLRASRIAWTVVLFAVVVELVEGVASGVRWFNTAIGIVSVLCLLAPSSIRYVWRPRPPTLRRRLPWSLRQRYQGGAAASYRVLAFVASWEDGSRGQPSVELQRSYRVLLWRLGVASATLLILFAATNGWYDSTNDSLVVSIVARIIRVSYVFVQVAFIAVLVIAIGHYLLTPGSRRSRTG